MILYKKIANVKALIKHIKSEIKRLYDIELELEIIIIE